MPTTMKEIRSYFLKQYGVSIPQLPLPNEELLYQEGSGYIDESLYASASAREHPYLIQGDIDEFISSNNMEYFLVGFWGYGANSYAFYYSRIDEWSHIFFRLPIGGVYMDFESDKVSLYKFLKNYIVFERALKPKAKSFVAIDSMGHGDYRIELNDGRKFQWEESLYRTADFTEKFQQFLS